MLICCIHLLCDWSFLSPHNLHFLFCYVLSISALIWLILMVLLGAAIRRDSVSLIRFFFLSHVHVFTCKISLVSHLKRPQSFFFFPFLFFGYFRSACPFVVSIVPGGCDQSSSAFFYVVFESLYRCINAVFNAGKSSSSFFLACQCHLLDAMPYAWSLVFLFFRTFV